MALTRAIARAMTPAELVALVVEQQRQLEARDAVIVEFRTLVVTLEARLRDLEQQLAQRDQNDPTKRMPGLKLSATPRPRNEGARTTRPHGFSRRPSATPTEVLDLLPVSPARVIHHVSHVRRRFAGRRPDAGPAAV